LFVYEYTDENFIIDTHPNHPAVLIVSACSGHGFKHSAAIGEIVAELIIEGKSTLDISGLKLQDVENPK